MPLAPISYASRRRGFRLLLVVALGLAVIVPAAAPAGAVVTVVQVAVGSAPRGVAVDPVTGRVFVANSGSANVTVLDGRANPPAPVTGSPVGVGNMPIGVAVDPATGRVFVANYGAANVTVLDGRASPPAPVTGSPVTVGTGPEGVAVNAVSGRVFVTNFGSYNVTVIDGGTLGVETLVGFNVPDFQPGVDPLTRRVFVSETGANRVTVLHDETDETVADAVAGVAGSTASAVNAHTDSAVSGTSAAVNAHTDSAVGGLPGAVNAHTDAGLAATDVKIDGLKATADSIAAKNGNFTDDVNAFLTGPSGAFPGAGDVDTSVEVKAGQPVFLACPVYFDRQIGVLGHVAGGTVQDGSHN